MNLLSQFQAFVKARRLFPEGSHLLLAVSGGLDSVVLLDLCKQSGYDLLIAHCNFGLRGEESDRDETFTRSLAASYDIPVRVRKFDTNAYAAQQRVSIQEAARTLRYDWFMSLAAEDQPRRYILTAHHADDNAETVLMNFFRGTGLHGLTGIPVENGLIRRPLLSFSRSQLEAYARERELNWVEDSSNQTTDYTRNQIRHKLLPVIEEIYPQVKENLQDNLRRFSDTDKLYQLAVGAWKQKIIRQKGVDRFVPVQQLVRPESRGLLYEIAADFGFTERQLPELLRLLEGPTGKWVASPDNQYRIVRHRHWLVISPVASAAASLYVVEKDQKEILFGEGKIRFSLHQPAGLSLSVPPDTALLDAAQVEFPLLLRKWKAGDYFYPFGMRKKKKIARFLIDEKCSVPEKERTWVIETNRRIAWIVGQRIDDRFRISPQTKQVLRLQWINDRTG